MCECASNLWWHFHLKRGYIETSTTQFCWQSCKVNVTHKCPWKLYRRVNFCTAKPHEVIYVSFSSSVVCCRISGSFLRCQAKDSSAKIKLLLVRRGVRILGQWSFVCFSIEPLGSGQQKDNPNAKDKMRFPAHNWEWQTRAADSDSCLIYGQNTSSRFAVPFSGQNNKLVCFVFFFKQPEKRHSCVHPYLIVLNWQKEKEEEEEKKNSEKKKKKMGQ